MPKIPRSTSERSQSLPHPESSGGKERSKSWKHTVTGLGFLAVTAAGIGLAAKGVIDTDKNIAITSDSARASDALSDTYDFLIGAGEIVGAGILGARGLRELKYARDPRAKARHNVAHAKANRHGLRDVATVSLLSVGAAVAFGSLKDIADEVGDQQTDVVDVFTDSVQEASGSDAPLHIISNTPEPELANAFTINPARANTIVTVSPDYNVTSVPLNVEWHKPSDGNKAQSIVFGLPPEVTGLETASEDCRTVPIAAAHEFGVEEGQTIEMDGLKLRVDRILDDAAGANLLSIVTNNDSFRRCINTNPDQPFNALLAQGEADDVRKLVQETGIAHNLSDRVYGVPMEQFMAATQQTGKNNVNPLILETIAISTIFAAGALGYKSRTELAVEKQNHAILRASGFSYRELAKIQAERAETEAIKASIIAMPVILAVDAYGNLGASGYAMGPSVGTGLSVLAFVYGTRRVSGAIAARRQLPKSEPGKEYAL